jgi:hypothetical protein
MSAADTAKILEHFMQLASKEIDVIATRVKFEPAAQATVVQILHGLSAATKKGISDFANTVQRLSEEDRERLLSPLENSGVVNTMELLIPLLELGDATDPGFLAGETAKILYAVANITDWAASTFPYTPPYTQIVIGVASALEGLALHYDLSSQLSGQAANEAMEHKINYIMDLPDGVDVPTVPQDTKPVSLTTLEKMLEVCKKFYKFEGAFTPTFVKDKQLIRIGPLATSQLPTPPIPLLVTGFIDLSGMQNHDVVTITTKVLEPTPTPSYVIWRVKTFTGHQSSGMKHFQDFSDLLEVPGDGVEVLIAQSASSHNFDPNFLLTIPYQFLVESTVLPQFVLT